MSNVINVVTKIFNSIFVTTWGSSTRFTRLIYVIKRVPLVYIGMVLLVIGFAVGVIRRLIRS